MPDTTAASHDDPSPFDGRRVVFAYDLATVDPADLMARTDFETVELRTEGPITWRGLVLVCPTTSSEELDIQTLRSAWNSWGHNEQVKVTITWAEDIQPAYVCGDQTSSTHVEVMVYPSEFFHSFDRPCEALRELLEDNVPAGLDFDAWNEGGDASLAERLLGDQVVVPVVIGGHNNPPSIEVLILEVGAEGIIETRLRLTEVELSDANLP